MVMEGWLSWGWRDVCHAEGRMVVMVNEGWLSW